MTRSYYICPRCGLKTVNRGDIVRHFSRKRPCADKNGVELTNEIRQTVLDNYIYHVPKPNLENKTIINNINNYNMIANLVSQMPYEEKLGCLMDHQRRNLLDLEEGLDQRFAYRIERLESDKFRGGYYLSLDDLYGLINDVTKFDRDHLEKFNVLFDRVLKRFRLYRSKEWESYIEEAGCRELVSLIKSYYLDTYEIYLIRNMHTDKATAANRVKLRDHLEIYYQFLVVFELTPHVQDFSDREILGHRLVEDNEYYLAERYLSRYYDLKKDIRITDKNRTKRRVISIVKQNTTHNLQELNQTVMELLKVDESFRDELLKSRQLLLTDENLEET